MGFSQIHGVDASQGMLNGAAEKNAYRQLDKLFLGSPSTFPKDLHNRFDFISASGILADNHLDNSVFEEMLLALKVGGIATFTSRVEYLETYGYGAYMEMLEKSGKWEFVDKVEYTKYDKLKGEVGQHFGRFKPTVSQVFAYRKL